MYSTVVTSHVLNTGETGKDTFMFQVHEARDSEAPKKVRRSSLVACGVVVVHDFAAHKQAGSQCPSAAAAGAQSRRLASRACHIAVQERIDTLSIRKFDMVALKVTGELHLFASHVLKDEARK